MNCAESREWLSVNWKRNWAWQKGKPRTRPQLPTCSICRVRSRQFSRKRRSEAEVRCAESHGVIRFRSTHLPLPPGGSSEGILQGVGASAVATVSGLQTKPSENDFSRLA